MKAGLKIFYDVDTQNDFMDRAGALYVPGAEEIRPNLEKLTDYAMGKNNPIIGSVDKHYGKPEYKRREKELAVFGGDFPRHCMEGSLGQKKIPETRKFGEYRDQEFEMNDYVPHELNNKFDKEFLKMKADEYARNLAAPKGLMFEKQSYDVFTNLTFEYFLKQADVKEAVVYGVATDYCVKAAVIGMQKRGIQCYVVKDAIAAVSPDTGEKSLEEMVKSGAKLITTQEVLENKMEW
ncbi:MAG TPA: isochorismatase family cysteine hydrolase [Candidatus Nanoarchaeia archaeon]|nr:isochorismatase family cysteine hydrolase [Candidatus Nanoarchaeia archaeon]